MLVNISQITSIEDLRVLAKKRLPRMFYDFVDSGAWTQSTYRANEADFCSIKLRQRVGVDIEHRSTATTLAGQQAMMPVAISPTGLAGFLRADGEILAARAAERFGIPYGLSIGSVCSIEDIRRHTKAPFWLQISMLRDREFLERLIERAKAVNCSALILTMDYHLVGQRHCDVKNGLSMPPSFTLRHWIDMARHPAWCLDMSGTKRRGFGNVIGHAKGVTDIASFAAWQMQQFELRMDWNMVEWIKRRWDGKLILKGVLDPDDARHALNAGADGISVSNQGGRQIDGAPSSIEALSYVVDAVGRRMEVFLDGGVRSGQDVLKAVALGAKGVLIGRAALYGLAAKGESGVFKVLEILHKELDYTMAFCGRSKIVEVDDSILWRTITRNASSGIRGTQL
ncbi:alpha-hydroxy acid oxidase [Variovorax sp. 38R]|uniref:alpha-hydroxy acid oxidase n=1 Tax=Variovorax sp. 38R TaxID=2774875 RepID=UPI0017831E17|nr:alpha-hydroxy acid oxidase [Variovorax sp. 38R]QOF82056.1 alpha-hydroxy-acid oxidizing protein [Variovorax sp. 38R]